MKKLMTLLIAFMLLNMGITAQNTVKLNINHELGTAPFAFNTAAQNNMGDDFKITRLEYYLSQFTIVHDGGMETNVNNVYALVDASQATTIDLGSHNITSVESIKFYIGVDSATNHTDPAGYSSNHALSPKFPSMHWGWASGYRFVALEGNGGSNYNQAIGLHALGNRNYNQATVSVAGIAANNEVVIDVYADYTLALKDIGVNSGTVVHGTDSDAAAMLLNFNRAVFNSFSTSTHAISNINTFKVFPNPSTNGQATIVLETEEDLTYQIVVTDILGRKIKSLNNVNSNTSLNIQIKETGLYFVQLIEGNGQVVLTEKLIIQ